MNRLENIARAYWGVSNALRHPKGQAMTTEKALRSLAASDSLRPTEHKLRELMHVLKYDIIEGNTSWRENRQVVGSILILRTIS